MMHKLYYMSPSRYYYMHSEVLFNARSLHHILTYTLPHIYDKVTNCEGEIVAKRVKNTVVQN